MPAAIPGPERAGPRRWPRVWQDLAAILWCSFLAACAGSVVFFGMVDPQELAAITTPSRDISRMTGYAIGFFFLWSVAGCAAVLTRMLLRRPSP